MTEHPKFPEAYFTRPTDTKHAASLMAHTLSGDLQGVETVLEGMDTDDLAATLQLVLILSRDALAGTYAACAEQGVHLDADAVPQAMRELVAEAVRHEEALAKKGRAILAADIIEDAEAEAQRIWDDAQRAISELGGSS